MPRTARIIHPNYPHHITQRGNRRMDVFFQESDYTLYMGFLSEQAERYGVSFWAYCLMTNHVHLIAVPSDREGLALMFREAHRRYTRYINQREGWIGHLWQDRYGSFVMNEPHALMAARYIENNPVHAGIVKNAGTYKWSSARYHLGKKQKDLLVTPKHPLKNLVPDWKQYLNDDFKHPERAQKEQEIIQGHEKSGKPLFLGTE